MGNNVSLCSGARLHELENKVVEQEETIQKLRRASVADLGQKETEVQRLQSELDGLKKQLSESHAAGESGEARIADLSGQIERLQVRLRSAELARDEHEKLRQEMEARDRRIEELQVESQRVKEQILAEQADERARTAQETAERDARIEELTGKLEATAGDVDRLLEEQKEANRIREQYEESQARMQELEPKVKSLSSLLLQRETELGSRQEELQSLSQRIAAMQVSLTEAERTRSALTLTRSEMEKLQVELEAKRRIEADLRDMENKYQEQQAQLQAERRKSVALEAKMQLEMLRRHRCFGVPLEEYTGEEEPGYAAPIPQVLVRLRDYLVERGGLNKEFIFRVAADQKDLEKAKDDLNRNQFDEKAVRDVSVFANLINTWFRELPKPLLHELTGAKAFKKMSKPKDAWKLVTSTLKEPALSVFSWLVDLCVQVSNNSDTNHMSPKALAIIFSPNVFTMPTITKDVDRAATEQIMNEINQYSTFIELCIVWRKENPPQTPAAD